MGYVRDRPELLAWFASEDFAVGPVLAEHAGALDLGPGARGDFLDKADLSLGPVARGRRMDIEESAQASGPDQRRADQGAGLDGVEGVGDRRRARIVAHI